MGNCRLAKNTWILALIIAVALVSATAVAADEFLPVNASGPAVGYALPMQPAWPAPGGIPGLAYSGCCYTFPIWAVYQCPAVMANQPGSPVVYLTVNPMAGRLGGQPYLYHP